MAENLTLAERQLEELKNWVRFVVEKFEKNEADGYHTRDRQFAIEVLGKGLERAGGGPSVAPAIPMDAAELNELWRLMHMAEIIARLYGLGFGDDQPACWPKHEQTVFAEAMSSGRWQKSMDAIKRACARAA